MPRCACSLSLWFLDSGDNVAIWLLGNRLLRGGDLWGDGALLIFPERQMVPLTFTEHTVWRAES